jgi:hypothetical protein
MYRYNPRTCTDKKNQNHGHVPLQTIKTIKITITHSRKNVRKTDRDIMKREKTNYFFAMKNKCCGGRI